MVRPPHKGLFMRLLNSLLAVSIVAVSGMVAPSLAFAQEAPGFANVERVYPVGRDGTAWKSKCSRHLVVDGVEREGFYDRRSQFEHDRPEVYTRGRRQCVQVPRAVGEFIGYRARVNERGRIFDQFVDSNIRPGDRVRVRVDAEFRGYEPSAYRIRPTQDWGDNYLPGYPYAERY